MKLLIAFLVLTLALAQSDIPAFKVIVDHFLIDQYKTQFLPKFQANITSKIQSLQIPAMSTTKKTLFFHTSVDIENIQIDSFSFDPSSVEVNFLSNSNGVTNGVALEINSFNLYVTANCHYAAGIIGSSGDLSASTSGSSLQVFANIDAVDGELQVTVTDINLSLNDFDVDIGGSFLSDILDMFIGLFKGKIKDSITSSIQNEKDSINLSIQKVLQLPSVYQVPNKDIALSFKITEAVFSSTQVEVAVSGYFFNSAKQQTPPPIPGPVEMNYIQQQQPVGLISTLLFTEYFVQSFLYAAQDSNSLNFQIQKDLNLQLTANSSTATIYVNSLKMPTISVTQQNLQAQLSTLVVLYFGEELFLNCSADATAIINADQVTEKLNITSLNISNVQVFYAQDKQFTPAVIEYIAAELIKQQISSLNDKINYIPINNQYVPFKAFLPRVSTQDQYFELNIDTNDVVTAEGTLMFMIQNMLAKSKKSN